MRGWEDKARFVINKTETNHIILAKIIVKNYHGTIATWKKLTHQAQLAK